MRKKVLIVEDQFVEANDLQLMLQKAGYEVCGIARSVSIAQELLKKEKPELVLLDIFLRGKLTGIDLAKQLRKENIAFIYLSANSNQEVLAEAKTTEPYGFIVKPFREKDLLITLEIAQYRHSHSSDSRLRREAEMIRQLENIASSNTSSDEILLRLSKIIQPEIPFDYLAVEFNNLLKNERTITSFLRIGFDEYQMIGVSELSTITGKNSDDLQVILDRSNWKNESIFLNGEEFEVAKKTSPFISLIADSFDINSLLFFPLSMRNGEVINFSFFGRKPETYSADHIQLLNRIQPVIPKFLSNDSLDKKPTGNDAIRNKNGDDPIPGFEGIIGHSYPLLEVLDQVTKVAPFDTSVLILGESGTGKERIATCIHQLSPRKGNAMIKVNCAALPSTLIESELFGHEKGSFTGATDKRIGKFEQANGGTIFLDEVGDMPLDLQVKLLRVLQEKEIEPIGSRSTIKIDVRVIAATNKNLEKEVAEGRFRLDLYYRLNVFPVELPALKDRLDDIEPLSRYFIDVYNRKAGKYIKGLSPQVLDKMMNYHWPGNIRELENMIERSVLLANGEIIEDMHLPIPKNNFLNSSTSTKPKSIRDNERDYIISILKKCNGRIWGAGGAAEILNVPPTTLKSKMKKLGIEKEHTGD